MNALLHINYALIWFFAALTLFGLYRPWLALWWLPASNRKMVLQHYGTSLAVTILSYLLLQHLVSI